MPDGFAPDHAGHSSCSLVAAWRLVLCLVTVLVDADQPRATVQYGLRYVADAIFRDGGDVMARAETMVTCRRLARGGSL